MRPITFNRLIAFAGACFMGMSFNLQAYENGGGKKPQKQRFQGKTPFKQAHFVKNAGQITTPDNEPASQVRFKATKGAVSVYFQEDRISYVYPKRTYQATDKEGLIDSMYQTTKLYRMDMVLKGASQAAKVIGHNPAKAKYRHFTSNGEMVKAKHYQKVVYKNIYPAIDLVYQFKNGQMKYEFVVKKGGDASDIQMAYKGAEELYKNENGGLTLTHSLGKLKEGKPVAFASLERQNPVSSSFRISNEKTVGFKVADEVNKPYVIDPFLKYSTYLGGSESERITSIAVNKAGNNQIVVGGITPSMDFPVTTGPTSVQGGNDAFLARYSSGGQLQQATYLSSSATFDIIKDISIVNKSSGFKIYAIGTSTVGLGNSTIKMNGQQPTKKFKQGSQSIDSYVSFLAQFSSNLALDKYSVIGSSNNLTKLFGEGIVAKNGKLFTAYTYETSSADFPKTSAANYDGQKEGVIAKLTDDLKTLKDAHYVGGNKDDILTDIKVNSNYQTIVKGITNSDQLLLNQNVDPAWPYQSAYGGGSSDYFFGSFSTQTSTIGTVTVSYLGGSDQEGKLIRNINANENYYNTGLDITKKSNEDTYIHITGFSKSTDYPVSSNALQTNHSAKKEVVYSRIKNIFDNSLDYSTYITGDKRDEGKSLIAFDKNSVLIGAITNSTNIDNFKSSVIGQGSNGTGGFRKSGGIDNFLVYLDQNSSGNNKIPWSSYFGGSSDDYLVDLANFPGGRYEFYTSGYTISNDYPATSNAAQAQNKGLKDGYITGFTKEQTCKTVAHTPIDVFQFQNQGVLSGSIKIQNKIVVPQGVTATITSADIVFNKCAEIIVRDGAFLTIEKSLLRSCNPFWKGIKVKPNGRLKVKNANIEDAQVGIEAKDPYAINVKNNGFDYNIHHVIYMGASVGSSSVIRENEFGEIHCQIPGNLSCNSIPNKGWLKRCNMVSVGPSANSPTAIGIDVEENQFNGVTSSPSGVTNNSRGLVIRSSENNYSNNTFSGEFQKEAIRISNTGDDDIINKNELELRQGRTGIKVVNCDQDATIANNTFKYYNASNSNKYKYGIYAKNTSSGPQLELVEIKNNIIKDAKHGVYIKDANEFLIQGNTISNCNHGIEYYADQNYTNATVIRENKITGGTASNPSGHGIVVAPIKDPVGASTGANNSTNTINLEIRCNKIWYNELGIVGSGYLIDQISSTQPAGNMFNDPANPQSSPSRNSEWDILWRNRFTTNRWTYHYSSQTIKPNDANNVTPNLSQETINGKTIGNGSNATLSQINRNGIGYLGCYGTWKRNPFSTGKQEVQDQPVRVYPNPVQDEVTIQTPDIGKGQIQVMDMTGQTILTDRIQGSSQILNTENWETGTYMIRITSQQGNTFTKKLLKVSQ